MEFQLRMNDSQLILKNRKYEMGSPLQEYHRLIRPLSRDQFDYLDAADLNDTRESFAPSRGRASTPSAAVRRAMQVLDETYKQQSYLKSERWSRSVDQGSVYSPPIRSHRSPSPVRSQSPLRRSNRSPVLPHLVEIERDNYQDALGDSESRREILLNRLAGAQQTMEMQNERLRMGEADIGESKATIRLLQQVQLELETKTQFLEKERNKSMTKSRQDAEEKEILRRKVADVSRESNRLRCQLDLMLADKQQHHVTLEHLHKTISDLQGENKNNVELQKSCSEDLNVTQERLEVARQRCELLEKEKNHAFAEVEKNQKTQQALINRNTELGQRNSRQQLDLEQLTDRLGKMEHELGSYTEELEISRSKLKKQTKDLTELRQIYKEMQQDKHRTETYNIELEKTVRSIKEINQDLKKAKHDHEDDITDLHADLAKLRLELSKLNEQNRSNATELKESRKTCGVLSSELSELRPRLDHEQRVNKDYESRLGVSVQQVALLEAEKAQLIRENQEFKTKTSTLESSLENLEEKYNKETKKLSEETKKLKFEKDGLATQLNEADSQLSRLNEDLRSHDQHSKSQLEHWRHSCSKMTSLLELKEKEMLECSTRWREAEEKFNHTMAQKKTLEIQLSEVEISAEELSHLRCETKRLGQECAENQQMITVLEMQRDILAKSPSKTNPQDGIQKAQIEKLEAEVTLLRTKLEHSNTGGQAIKTPNDESAKFEGMTKMMAEQLTKTRKDSAALQSLLEEKTRNFEREISMLKREKQQLEIKIQNHCDDITMLKTNQSRASDDNLDEQRNLREANMRLRQEVTEQSHRVMVLEGELVLLGNGKRRLEDQVRMLQCGSKPSLETEPRKSIQLDTALSESAALRMRLKEIEEIRSSQDGVIEALKQQLETSTVGDCDVIDRSHALIREVNELKRKLNEALLEKEKLEREVTELKVKFIDIQRSEQLIRQERDELQGKTIVMESLNNSSQDLLKELEEVREDKNELEQQLNLLLASKTSQTPPSSLSLVNDLDCELEKQYNTLRERNKWLESRIVSLQREVDLVRDQNSLLQEQRNNAEREAERSSLDLKDLQMTAKGKRQRIESEQVHLQNSNADKMHQILELERELSEKKQIIKAMALEMEGNRKKTEKSKISTFMKKLRRSSDSSSREPDNTSLLLSTRGSYDPGYSTGIRSLSLSPKSRSSSFGGFSRGRRSSLKTPSPVKKGDMTKASLKSPHLVPVSPSLTYVTAVDDSVAAHGGEQPRPMARSVSFDADDQEGGVFYSDDYIGSSNTRSSGPPTPSNEPTPSEAPGLPTPTSSPSLPSPTSARRAKVGLFVVSASDDSGSEEMGEISENSRSAQDTRVAPQRPHSQPIIREYTLSTPEKAARKKHSSLV